MRIHSSRSLRAGLWLVVVIFALLLPVRTATAWEWSDFVSGGEGVLPAAVVEQVTTLSMHEVSDMRARDIKRRLARTHGYSAEELAKMIDKKDLIGALSFEEEKVRLKQEEALKRALIQRGIMAAVVTVLLLFCWPVLQHGLEVAHVNFVVYTDRKKYEASRCWELQSGWGVVGIVLMSVFDVLQVWLTASILLSWVMTSKYFFPVPRLPIRPAQFMGGDIAKGPMANYGINIGSMLVTWGLRFAYGKIERWTGKALAAAHRKQRKEARVWEGEEEKAARRAARKHAKLEKQQRREQAAAAAAANSRPATQISPDWMPPAMQQDSTDGGGSLEPPNSDAHLEFLEQLDAHTSKLDELD